MKILYISNSYIPSKTANSLHVMKMCQAFADNGHETILVAPDRPDVTLQDVADPFEYYNVSKSYKLQFLKSPKIGKKTVGYICSLFNFLRKNKFDVIYSRFLIGTVISVFLRRKTIFESHDPVFRNGLIKKILFNYISNSKKMVKIVVISEALKKIYTRYNTTLTSKLCVAHDGSDSINDFSTRVKLRGAFDFNVGYIGHLYPGKGVEVIELVSPMCPNVGFHIIGGLEQDIDHWKSKIKQDNVFFYGFLPQSELTKYINSLDICLLPNQHVVSVYGGGKTNISEFTSPLKMFDYMAHKKAIISSNLPVLKEVLNDTSSILVDPEDFEGWQKAIEQLSDDELRNSISQKAYDDFEKKYSWKRRAKNILKELDEY